MSDDRIDLTPARAALVAYVQTQGEGRDWDEETVTVDLIADLLHVFGVTQEVGPNPEDLCGAADIIHRQAFTHYGAEIYGDGLSSPVSERGYK